MTAPLIKRTPYGSVAYHEAIELRSEILRKPLGLEFTQEQLDAEHDQIHIVCYVEHKLQGALALQRLSDTDIKMRQVAVAEEMQGNGLGKLMALECERIAKEEGYERIVIHAREVAFQFYESLGYTWEGDYFEEVGLKHKKGFKAL